MSTGVTSASPLSAAEIARRRATLPGAARQTGSGGTLPPTSSPTAGTGGVQQASVGAQQAQAEPFNAPMLQLPDNPTTLDVMDGLARAMADPSVNQTTAQRLFQLHQQLMEAEKAMAQAVIDGMLV